MTVVDSQRKVWCRECGAFLGKQHGIGNVAGPFELAPGFVALGKRSFGPGKLNASGMPRSTTPLGVNRPEPVTIRCRCGTVTETLVMGGTTG